MKSYSTLDFLEALFNPGESTCFTDSGKGTLVEPVFSKGTATQFFSVNPLDTDRRDLNVTAFRTFLIECDRMPQDEQLAYIRGLGMPWTTCVDSGGKSVHFTICLAQDLADEASYRQFAARIHRAVEKADHTTKNPSRLSRLGGALRDNGKEQRILGIRGRVSHGMLENWLSTFPEAKHELKLAGPVAAGYGVLSQKTLDFVFSGLLSVEGRNNSLFMAACEFYRAGFTIQKAGGFLAQAFDFNGKDRDFAVREFEETILSAYRRAESDSRSKR